MEQLRVVFNNFTLRENKKALLLACFFAFPIIVRVVSPITIALFFLIVFIFFVYNHFENYVNQVATSENKNVDYTEYSWGFVHREVDKFDIKNLINFLKAKDFDFYKQYIKSHIEYFVLVFFLIADMVVAFKNLSLEDIGIYFSLTIFTKFVFVSYFYINKYFKAILTEDISEDEKQIRILDIFYKHFNGLVSISFVIFVLFFTLSKYISEIFFGFSFVAMQSSLPFTLLANLFLVVGMLIFRTAMLVDRKATLGVLKIYIPIFTILFVFMNINYYDTVAYFVIGASSVLSIFLYNFAIRKPAYIESTYNFLF